MNNDISLIKKYLPIEKQPQALARLEQGEPVQYIIGNVDFCDCLINVNEHVLIPRFETETLVAKTIAYIKTLFPNQKVNILELGTGSGCISIALKKNLDCTITAVDISSSALEVAKENAILNNAEINFQLHDMTKQYNGHFDIIISNPPYIASYEEVEEKVKNYEPSIALYAEEDGIYFYKQILSYAKNILNNPFLIAFEIGHLQQSLLEPILQEYQFNFSFEEDLTHRTRYLFIYL